VEIDVVIEEGGTLYPIEIKTTSDPTKSHAAAFSTLKKIPQKTIGDGAVICMCKDALPLSESVWMLPVSQI